jgi:hypothetical protein
MDALYFINTRTKQTLLFKEYKQNDNNLKLHLFLAELSNILIDEKSPFVLINNSIFIYYTTDDNEILYLSILSEDVYNINLVSNYFSL